MLKRRTARSIVECSGDAQSVAGFEDVAHDVEARAQPVRDVARMRGIERRGP